MNDIIKFPKNKKFVDDPGCERRIKRIEALINELEYEIFKGLQVGDLTEGLQFKKIMNINKDEFFIFRFDLRKTDFPGWWGKI
jgi:hypothetical protein